MSKTEKTSSKPSSEAILVAVAAQSEITAAEVASVTSLGRSTASKVLARLVDSGKLARVPGGRDGARRLPDRFSLVAGKPMKAAKRQGAGTATGEFDGERLKPGQLDGLVLAFLQENANSGPHGPTTVAKALQRSSGAVGNCLVRLARAKKVRQDSDKPRRYSFTA